MPLIGREARFYCHKSNQIKPKLHTIHTKNRPTDNDFHSPNHNKCRSRTMALPLPLTCSVSIVQQPTSYSRIFVMLNSVMRPSGFTFAAMRYFDTDVDPSVWATSCVAENDTVYS